MYKKEIWVFVCVMIVVTAFAIWKADFLQSYGNVVQAWVTVVLVVLTAAYVRQTGRQAEASIKMAEDEARPILLLRLNLKKDGLLQWDDYQSNRRPSEFSVKIHNAGKGPAINLCAALWHQERTCFPGATRGYLAPNEEWNTIISRLDTAIETKVGWLPKLKEVIKQNNAGVVTVEYKDIHQRCWVSYLCLDRHVDVDAFVMDGELNIVEAK